MIHKLAAQAHIEGLAALVEHLHRDRQTYLVRGLDETVGGVEIHALGLVRAEVLIRRVLDDDSRLVFVSAVGFLRDVESHIDAVAACMRQLHVLRQIECRNVDLLPVGLRSEIR